MVVAWSYKSRGFCPSCTGRRMAQTATNWLEHVLPATPLRQLVVTFPYELRPRLAYDGKTLTAVGRIFMDSVLGFYRRRMREEGIRDGRCGALMVVQRNSADLKLNPHMHAIFVDGVFQAVPAGKPEGAPEDTPDEKVVLSSTDGSYSMSKGVKDDQVPNDDYLQLKFEGLDPSLSYTLEVITQQGSYKVFEDVAYADLSSQR